MSAAASMRGVVVVIPARWGSTRFPGKVLAPIAGRPMIQWVHERAREVAKRVIVATDDERVAVAVRGFGGEVVLTRADHANGTSRIAEVAESLHEEIVVNVQGDEPGLEPSLIDAAAAALRSSGRTVPMATIASPFRDDEDPADPNIVKVVVGRNGRALYFSRSLIPFARDATRSATSKGRASGADAAAAPAPPLKHVGLYAYRRRFLATFTQLESTPLERTEQLEQLRVLEHGYDIAVAIRDASSHGIDTPEQLKEFERVVRSRETAPNRATPRSPEQPRNRGST